MRPGVSLAAAGALAGLALAAGCDDSAYCFDCGGEGGATTVASSVTSSSDGGAGVTVASASTFTTTSGGGSDCDADTSTDVNNCGECDNRCELPGAIPACEEGECVIDTCIPGNYDLDPEVPGCEYACVVPEPSPEACDGIDNDCDSFIDVDDPDLEPPPGFECNTEPGTPCEDAETICDPGQGWRCEYPAGVEQVRGIIADEEGVCDGIDGDCDGEADEFFLDLGDDCDDGGIGACRDFGLVKCDPDNENTTFCDLSELPDAQPPGIEECNDVDDDCNGFVDDALAPEAFATIDVGGVLVDVYEASRPDATAAEPGFEESVACSSASVLPWTGGAFAEATAACAARGAGFRLCTAAELESACRGPGDSDYPYGDAFDDDACNGVERGEGEAVPTGSIGTCIAEAGFFDLSGNVAEWTATQTNSPAVTPDRIFQLHGGSYLAPELGLACTIELAPRALEVTLLPSIGFRCCYDPP